MTALIRRLKAELRDGVERCLIPGLAAVLPWPVCYRLFRLFSLWERLYYVEAAGNTSRAAALGWVNDAAEWRRKWRLVAMVDQADMYLSLTRGDRWMRRHLRVEGSWPPADGPLMLMGFHWGVGMWTLRHLTASGLKAHALIGPLTRDMYPGRRLRYEYSRVRNRVVRRAMGTEPIDVTASLKGMIKALNAGDQVLALVDVPSYLSRACEDIEFLGARVPIPSGVFRLAVERAIPVVLFINGFRFSDGEHFLRIVDIGVETDVPRLMKTVFAHLERLIAEEPVAWHFWGADGFFVNGPPVRPQASA